jgi:aspartate ammonia-lyase
LELKEAKNKIQSQQSLGDFAALSASIRCLCIEMQKISNDLRLLNSGPHTGLCEIELPAKQSWSSLMPGNANPAIAEMMNMVCFHISGHDQAIAACAEAGQLELNVMTPYVAYALLESLRILAKAITTFDKECVREIKARPEQMRKFAERSIGQAALLNEEIGFMVAAEVAIKATETDKTIREVAEERKFSTDKLL